MALVALGVAAMVYGAVNLIRSSTGQHLPELAKWFVGVLVVHDLVIVPLVAVLALLLGRVVPAAVRPIVQGALLVAAVIGVIATPVILRAHAAKAGPSVLPRDYVRGTELLLACVFVLAVVVGFARQRRARRAG